MESWFNQHGEAFNELKGVALFVFVWHVVGCFGWGFVVVVVWGGGGHMCVINNNNILK